MGSAYRHRPPTAADAQEIADLAAAYERSLYGETAYTIEDLRAEWEALDLERDALVLLDEDRIVAYGMLADRGDLWRIDGCVHPAARGRGLGTQLVTTLESIAAARGARRLQASTVEADEAGRRLLGQLGYRPVRVFRELRIRLDGALAPPSWPEGLVPDDFDRARDAAAFHRAHQEAFADHWEYRPRDFASWRRLHLESGGFDASLWRVVRAGGEIAGGAICEANRYGGGWVAVVFTRRPWRGRGVGRALLRDAFAKFRERGETSVGLSVDAENATGAFHLYESLGMRAVMGWVMHEKAALPA